jgi:hypothetical protein
MYLSLNFSRESFVFFEECGTFLPTIEEERLGRVRNYYGDPNLAIQNRLEKSTSDAELGKIICGAFQTLDEDSLIQIPSNSQDWRSNPKSSWKLPRSASNR